MKFTVVTPHYSQEHTINWIEVITPYGELTIQPGHAPMILTLLAEKKITFMHTTGEEETLHLNRPGFLEVQRNEVIALLNQE